jgi:hypothetical protein
MRSIETPKLQDRTGRLMIAGGAALVALRAIRNGNPIRGVLIMLGALTIAFTGRRSTEHTAATVEINASKTTPDQDDSEIEVDAKMTDKTESTLRCAICKEPIVPGQPRGPDAQDRTVHEACLQVAP